MVHSDGEEGRESVEDIADGMYDKVILMVETFVPSS